MGQAQRLPALIFFMVILTYFLWLRPNASS